MIASPRRLRERYPRGKRGYRRLVARADSFKYDEHGRSLHVRESTVSTWVAKRSP